MPTETLLARTKRLLRTYGLQARKGLGQHFLVDSGAVDTILNTAQLTREETVVEVGPGLGVMTDELAKLAGKVIAVELDGKLAGILKEKFGGAKQVEIINQDILKTDLAVLTGDRGTQAYKVVANLPYYITSAVIRHFLEATVKPSLLVLMTQKEVAQQITAPPGEMSLLSVSVQLYGEPKLVDIVPAGSFYPAPRVDSAILSIDVYPTARVGIDDVEGFFTLVKAGFSANRKQIINPLSHQLAMERPDVLALLAKAGIDYHRRAETLTIAEWKRLFEVYYAHK